MSAATEVRVPDIGDFTDVPVIEILVAPGDTVAIDDPLVTLESDKATMEIPAPVVGVVKQLRVAIGDRVSEGSVLVVVEAADADLAGAGEAAPGVPLEAVPEPVPVAPPEPVPVAPPRPEADHRAQVVVLGAGPGGYTAAFRAADLNLKVTLI